MKKQPIDKNLNYPLIVAKSRISGKGAFAAASIPARTKLGNMGGEIIPYKEVRKRIKNQKPHELCMVEFNNDPIALDASVNRNALSYINHSCNPNTYMRRAYRKVEFYTLRKIRKGEELSCDYGETHHDGNLPCRCGAPNCKGYL